MSRCVALGISVLALVLSRAGLASVFPPEFNDITTTDITQSTLAFVSSSTGPGLEGASQRLKDTDRESVFNRSSLGSSADFLLKNTIFDGYWGGALISGTLQEQFFVPGVPGAGDVNTELNRDITALRGSFGLSFPLTANWRLRPHASLIYSQFKSYGYIVREQGISPLSSADSEIPENQDFGRAESLSSVVSVETSYISRSGELRQELRAQYSATYTDLDNTIDSLDSWGWNHWFLVKGNTSGPTGLHIAERPINWMLYGNYTHYLNLPKEALGFNRLLELGIGSELIWRMKPLDWFGMTAIGLKAGVVVSDDVVGYQLSMVLR